jgi:hypothetical protein
MRSISTSSIWFSPTIATFTHQATIRVATRSSAPAAAPSLAATT